MTSQHDGGWHRDPRSAGQRLAPRRRWPRRLGLARGRASADTAPAPGTARARAVVLALARRSVGATMTERRPVDLDALSADTIAHVSRALHFYARAMDSDPTVPDDWATPEFVDLAHAVAGAVSTRVHSPVAGNEDTAEGDDVPILLTRAEFASMVGCSERTVDRWRGDGRIPFIRRRRAILIPSTALDAVADLSGVA